LDVRNEESEGIKVQQMIGRLKKQYRPTRKLIMMLKLSWMPKKFQ
jgi:hypothetical protein